MPKMIDLIRQSAVPANVMRTAAKGALTLPPDEMIEVLVYLAANSIFAEQAKMTLAGWDEASSIAVAGNSATPWEVLTYMIAPENLRPKLVPALLENNSVREAAIAELAQKSSRELIEMMMRSRRVRNSATLLHALLTNSALNSDEENEVRGILHSLGEETQRIQAYQDVDLEEKTQWEIDHAAEIAAEEAEAKPFSFFGNPDEDLEQLEAVAPVAEGETAEPTPVVVVEPETVEAVEAAAAAPEGEGPAALAVEAAKLPAAKPAPSAQVKERLSALQKIARLNVGQRIQLAMKGNKEERFILVRDGSKLVSEAVLQSAKLTEAEVEMFAGMKNLQENVLRGIARSHKFMKNYAVIRALAGNPRAPLDLSLTLMNHLLVNDLKALSVNKNVPDTLRKLSLKKFKEKTEKKG